MAEQDPRPDGTGFHLAGGELTATGSAEQTLAVDQPVDFSVTAAPFGGAEPHVVLASWSTAVDLGGVRADDGRIVLPLRTQPLMLNSLPRTVRVRLQTAAGLHDTEGIWQATLHFQNAAGAGLTWQAGLPAEAFGDGWEAPLADLLTFRNAPASEGVHGVSVVHHADAEYYELLVDGQRAGILVYHAIGESLSITHTVIDPAYRGQGLSWVLVRHALDDLRKRPITVSNFCAVVSRFVEKNPEYGELFAVRRPA
ncbi:GNAT family N-acetyltransferase [Kribbella sp. NPDC051770]|uniref:GNAT family N-acetyltransferase n=1 Tax=Kribbella sp. NPDC051770 TaxID=3155413 RepID=UPI003413A4A5